MSSPNFLTANISGIELMPGINDNAVGYDVNRIIQALNGTNLVPIIVGDLTVQGNEIVTGTLNVTGAVTFSSLVGPLTINPGGLTVTTGDITDTVGNLIFGAASAKIIPGVTSFLFRDHADANTNLSITDAGIVAIRSGLTVTAGGETITAGNLSLTVGDIIISLGNLSAVTGTFSGRLTTTSFTKPGSTSFPGSPATNDHFYRTDIGMEFYYDGTRWLSTELFAILTAINFSTTINTSVAAPIPA